MFFYFNRKSAKLQMLKLVKNSARNCMLLHVNGSCLIEQQEIASYFRRLWMIYGMIAGKLDMPWLQNTTYVTKSFQLIPRMGAM